MKREDLEKLGLNKEQIDAIMAENGKDIEAEKAKLAPVKTEVDGLKSQLVEANKQIEAFKGMNVDQIKASADEWKLKAETATSEAAKQLAQVKFDHALDGALTGAKARNTKAVKALLSTEAMKFNEADGSIIGLNEQLEKIKTENEFLFDGGAVDPKIVAHTNNKTVITDSVIQAARKAAGLPTGE